MLRDNGRAKKLYCQDAKKRGKNYFWKEKPSIKGFNEIRAFQEVFQLCKKETAISICL